MALPKPLKLEELPKVKAFKQFGCAGIHEILDPCDELEMSKMVSPLFLKLSRGTPVEEVLKKELVDLRSRILAVNPSWRWIAMKTLSVSTTDRDHFLKNCLLTKYDFARLFNHIVSTLLPPGLLGEKNHPALVDFLCDYIFLTQPPTDYPSLHILASNPLRACRVPPFRSNVAQFGLYLNQIQEAAIAQLTHYCSVLACTIAMQFVEMMKSRTGLASARRSFYSKRGYNFWKKKEMAQFQNDYQLERVPPQYYNGRILPHPKQTISNVQIIPSNQNLRPICPFDKKLEWSYTNRLQAINAALDYHIQAAGWKPICGTHKEIRSVKHHLSRMRTEYPNRRLYFVKSDVTKCFANLNHELLRKCLEELIGERPSVVAHCKVTSLSFRVRKAGGSQREAMENLSRVMRNKYKDNKVCSRPEFTHFTAGLVDEIMKCIDDLRFRVDHNENKLYRMKCGVPQGCQLSSRLAHIYLCAFDRYRFGHFSNRSAVFRYADDYLFVLQRREDAIQLLDKLQEPKNAFGLKYKKEKTQASFNSVNHGIVRKGREMNWCGWTIDTVANKVLSRTRHTLTGLVVNRRVLGRLSVGDRIKLRQMWKKYQKKVDL